MKNNKSLPFLGHDLANIGLKLTLVSLCLFAFACRKDDVKMMPQDPAPIAKEAVKEWVSQNPISQVVEPRWQELEIVTTENGEQIGRMPISSADIFAKVNASNTLMQKQLQGGNKITSANDEDNAVNPNFSEQHPPEMFFKRDKNGKLRGYILNFVPTDKLKENGENNVWTGKLYEWNMTGDTMLVVDYVKSKIVKKTLTQLVAANSGNNTGISSNKTVLNTKIAGLKPSKVVSQSIWEWLGSILSNVWEGINYIGYHIGIPGAKIRNYHYGWLVRTWDLGGNNNISSTDYIAADDQIYGFYLTGDGGGQRIPEATMFDRLILLIGLQSYAHQQFLAARPDIQQGIDTYLNANGKTPENLEFSNWIVYYLKENPSENVEALFINGISNYYTNAEMAWIINSMADPITGKGIELYLVVKYQGSKLFELSRYSKAANSVQAGPYTLTPHYDQNGSLLFYSGYRNAANGIEYIIRADQMNEFKTNVDYYTRAASLVYMNGIPSKGMIQMMAGDRVDGLLSLWSEAIKSPEYWIYLATLYVTNANNPTIRSKINVELQKPFTPKIAPSGLGTTGRTVANNLTEQLAMKEIMSNPHVGTMTSLPPLSDVRWLGWRKMTNINAHGVEIHYVAKFENGIIVAVDDFKFIN